MELIYDDKTGTWGEAPEAYAVINCATKEDYEFAKRAIKTYKELEAKHWDECRQIAHYDDELTEAKRLLKAAMEDMKMLYETGKDEGCVGIKFKWRYADEALKLIGGSENG